MNDAEVIEVHKKVLEYYKKKGWKLTPSWHDLKYILIVYEEYKKGEE